VLAANRFASTKMLPILALAGILAASFVIAMDVRQSLGKGIHDPNDFVTLYAGAICASHECNPYSVPDLQAVLQSRRGDEIKPNWEDQLPIYPPTTLLLLEPLAKLPYAKATLIWFVLSFSIYLAGLVWAFLFSPYLRGTPMAPRVAAVLLGLHFPKMMQCLSFGNPSVLVIGLMLFAVVDDVRARFLARTICIGVAVLLKATVAFPLLLVVIFGDRTRPRRAWVAAVVYTAVVAVLLMCAGIPAGMRQWSTDLDRNLALGERGGMSPSGRISPSNVLLNVANIPGYFTENRAAILVSTLIILAILTTFLSIGVIRLRRQYVGNQTSYAALVPVVAVMTLLPVYHRFCDIGLILFVIPWLIQRVPNRIRPTGWGVALLLGLLYFSWERRVHLDRLSGRLLDWSEFLYYRGDALLILILAGVLIATLYLESRAEPPDVGPVLRDAA
jgi:hypothetical protein